MKTICDRAKHERATKEWQFFLSVYLVRNLEERRSNVLERTLKARLRGNAVRFYAIRGAEVETLRATSGEYQTVCGRHSSLASI